MSRTTAGAWRRRVALLGDHMRIALVAAALAACMSMGRSLRGEECTVQPLASPNGPGVRVDADCMRAEGTFFQGELWGKGKFTDPYMGAVYEGDFVEGRLHGYGRVAYTEERGGNWHEGYFWHGEAYGPGRNRGNGGVLANGFFHAGRLEGAGVLTFENGVQLLGEYRAGVGVGTMLALLPDGKQETGDFSTLFDRYAYRPLSEPEADQP